MNRLAGTRGYLCGAMDFAADCGLGWRKKIQEDLAHLDIVWLDPTNKPCKDGTEGQEEVEYGYRLMAEGRFEEAARFFKPIRHIDLRMVDICDFMVVHLDMEIHHCGTYEELFWCNRMKKPIVVWVKQGKAAASRWLFATIPHQLIFGDYGRMIEYLKHIAEDHVIDTMKRWEFFDFHGEKST